MAEPAYDRLSQTAELLQISPRQRESAVVELFDEVGKLMIAKSRAGRAELGIDRVDSAHLEVVQGGDHVVE